MLSNVSTGATPTLHWWDSCIGWSLSPGCYQWWWSCPAEEGAPGRGSPLHPSRSLCHSDISWVSPDSNLIRCAFSAWSRPSHQTSSVLAILQSSVLCDLPYQSSYIFEVFFTTNLSHSSLRAWPDIFISLQHSSCVMLNTGLWLTWERKDEKVSDLKSTYWYQVIHLTQPDPWRWCQLFDISNLQCEALKNV